MTRSCQLCSAPAPDGNLDDDGRLMCEKCFGRFEIDRAVHDDLDWRGASDQRREVRICRKCGEKSLLWKDFRVVDVPDRASDVTWLFRCVRCQHEVTLPDPQVTKTLLVAGFGGLLGIVVFGFANRLGRAVALSVVTAMTLGAGIRRHWILSRYPIVGRLQRPDNPPPTM